MVAVQTTYSARQPEALAGMVADMVRSNIDSRFIETAAGIAAGLAVSQGTSPKGVVLGGAAFFGVTVLDPTLLSANADKYPQKALAGILNKGDIWVRVQDDVAIGDAVEYDAPTGELGADGGTKIHSARWIKAATAGNLALLRLGDIAQPTDLTA